MSADRPDDPINRQIAQLKALFKQNGGPEGALTLLRLFETILSSTPVATFYNRTLDLIEALFDAEIIFIMMYDRKEDVLKTVASRGLPIDPALPSSQPIEGILRRLLLDKKPSLIKGIQTDPFFRFKSHFRERAIPSIVGLPLKVDGKPIGLLGFYAAAYKEMSELAQVDPRSIDLLALIASEIAVRIENMQLNQEEANRRKDIQALSDVSQSVSATLDLTEVFRRISRETARYLGADMVGAYRLDKGRKSLAPVAGYSTPKEKLEIYRKTSIPITGFPFLEQSLETQRPGVISISDPRCVMPSFLKELFPLKTLLFIPIMTRGENFGALFAVWWEMERVVRPEEIYLIEVFSRQASIAAENAGLYHNLDQKIIELRRLQEQLVQTEKLSAIGELVSGVAHELNNPLTSILGFSELLLDSPQTDSVQKQVNIIHNEAVRCSKIIQSLLAFSKSGAFTLKETDLRALVERTLEIKSRSFSLDGVEVRLEFDENLPLISVDENQMQQVFLNIFNNAHQAMMDKPEPRKLTIKGSKKGDFIRLVFEDTGPGIPEDVLPKIFNPFFTTKPIGIGTGLGLSVSYGIIQAHGGRLFVESQRGKGAQFYIDLPIQPNKVERMDPIPESAPHPEKFFNGKRILVLDDERFILEMVRNSLSASGAEVTAFSTAIEALAGLKNKSFDLILSDIKMSEMDGIQFYEALIQEAPEMADKVVFLTGDVMEPRISRFLSERRRPVLHKPFQIQELHQIILKSLHP